MPASSDRAVKVSSDHRPEFLTPGLEDGGIKQLGRPAIGRADVDLGLRTAGQEGDSEFRKLSQPQRRHLATVMQCDQPVSHRLVVDADLRPARSIAGELGGEIGQEDQRAGVSGGVAGNAVEQPLGVGLGQLGVLEGGASTTVAPPSSAGTSSGGRFKNSR